MTQPSPQRTTVVLTPEEILATDRPAPVAVRRPDPASHFADRAMRLRSLAAGHPLGDWLNWQAALADAQQQVLNARPLQTLPEPHAGSGMRAADRRAQWFASGEWIDRLGRLLDALQAAGTAAPTAELAQAVERLRAAPRDRIRAYGAALLARVAGDAGEAGDANGAGGAGDGGGAGGAGGAGDAGGAGSAAAVAARQPAATDPDPGPVSDPAADPHAGAADPHAGAVAPFIAAALQLDAVARLSGWHPALGPVPALPRDGEGLLCPCCGSHPSASIVQIGGSDSGSRYLNCGLCDAQWHFIRVRCALCGSTSGLRYHGLQAVGDDVHVASDAAARQPAQLESCDHCHRYLKLLDRTLDPSIEAVADDLATLALDALAEGGSWQRGGASLFIADPRA